MSFDVGIFNVDDFVAARASQNDEVQQPSTSDPQQVQYQSITNNPIPQCSIGDRIWFGTRGSTSTKPFRFNIENAKQC
jgi:hypothetical protein